MAQKKIQLAEIRFICRTFLSVFHYPASDRKSETDAGEILCPSWSA